MTDIIPIILAVSLSILTIVLVAVGVQLFLALKAFRHSLDKVNAVFDETEEKIKAITQPLQNLAGIVAGVKTGAKVFEGFVQFLNNRKSEDSTKDSRK